MPTYSTPRHGVSLSDAIKEAAAIAPIDRPMLDTFELYQPVGTPGGAVRVVNDNQDLTATLEAGAPRDASTAVLFMAASITADQPEESDSASSPVLTLSLSNVSGQMSDALRLARGSLDPWELIHRIYAADDLTAPAVDPPRSLLVVSVDLDAETISLKCSFADTANVSIPRVTFKRTEYTNLTR